MEKTGRKCPNCGAENVTRMGLCIFCSGVACEKCGATELTYEMNKVIAHAECFVEKTNILTRAFRFLHLTH